MNATVQSETTALAVTSASAGALLMNSGSMDRLERIADLMASGKTTVPQHLRSSKGDCFAICLQAMQWGMNPFAVAQKTHLVNGTLGYEAQLVAAVINSSGLVRDRFHFEWFGAWEKIIGKFKEVTSTKKMDDNGQPKKFIVPDWNAADEKGLGVKVYATLRGESAPRELTLLMTQARTRNSTLWTEDPKQQIAYLAQKRWARLYAPDVILGVYTGDELEEPTERHMGMVEEVTTETQTFYPADQFAKNLPTWEDVLKSGRKAADDFINFAASRGTPYTDAQITTLRAIKVDPQTAPSDVEAKPAATAAAAVDGEAAKPAVTYAVLAAALHAATTQAELTAAAEQIGEVIAAEQRAELVAIHDARVDALPPF